MTGTQRRFGEHEALPEFDAHHRAAAPTPAPTPGTTPSLDRAPTVTVGSDPRLAHAAASAPGLLSLQRSAGNAAVASLVGSAPPVQRTVTVGEITTVATPDEEGARDPGTDQAAAESTHGAVMVIGGATEINGSPIRLNSPMVEAQGVLRAETIIADNVIGSNYTPGAGNTW
jgi:hypothetical protein